MTLATIYKFTVPGRPVPAVRMTQRSKFRSRADKYLTYKRDVGWAARAAHVRPIEGPVELRVRIYVCGGRVGDADNYLKSIADSLNYIAYEDDKQVVKMTVERISVDRKGEQRADVEVETWREA